MWEMPEDTPRVVLIGPPASGKTKIGKRVAALLGVPHIDTDRVVVANHGPIPQLFRTVGEEGFRVLERQAVVDALGHDAVVSLGGGAVTTPATLSDLGHHTVIGLTISSEAVAHRLDNDKRPLLTGGLESWEALVVARQPLYRQVATWSVDVSHRSPDDVAEEIVSWLRDREETP
jgi:shikimate kinase